MGDPIKKHKVSGMTETDYEEQTETLEVQKDPQKLFIGIPREETLQENRVALIPSSVATLIGRGHRVIIEQGAGRKSSFNDRDYTEVGAEIARSKEEVFKADVLIKVAPPTLEETELLHPNQLLISPLQIPIITREIIENLRKKRVIAVAMEYLQDDDGSFPLVRIMSEMAGISAMLTAAELLSNTRGGKGVLLGGVSGVPPAKVIILGAGVVGEFASRVALGLGAEVRVFDNNIYKLMRIKNRLGRQIYTSAINQSFLERELIDANVVIGAIHSQSGRAPMVVNEQTVMKMQAGTVIIDVSIDQGGCFETSEVTSHDDPTFVKYDVIHYCVPNIASKVSRTASIAVSNILSPILIKAGHTMNIEQLFFAHKGLRHGVYSYKGALTNEYLSKRFDLKYTDLDLLITSNL